MFRIVYYKLLYPTLPLICRRKCAQSLFGAKYNNFSLKQFFVLKNNMMDENINDKLNPTLYLYILSRKINS